MVTHFFNRMITIVKIRQLKEFLVKLLFMICLMDSTRGNGLIGEWINNCRSSGAGDDPPGSIDRKLFGDVKLLVAAGLQIKINPPTFGYRLSVRKLNCLAV